MRLVDCQLFPHHSCVLILGSNLSVFHVLERSSNAQGLNPEGASSSEDCMTPLMFALAIAQS